MGNKGRKKSNDEAATTEEPPAESPPSPTPDEEDKDATEEPTSIEVAEPAASTTSTSATLSTEPITPSPTPEPSSETPADVAPPPPPKEEDPPVLAPRRPKPPSKGILKPPPPPAKPTLGNRLRDMVVASVTGEVPGPSSVAGQHHPGQQAVSAAVGTLNAISGRLGLAFNRFANQEQSAPPPPPPKPTLPQRSTSLAQRGGSAPGGPGAPPPPQQASMPAPGIPGLPGAQPPVSPRARQKQPLKRATFVLPSLSITYPISSQSEPWSKKVLDDREKIESRQRDLLATARGGEYWTSIRLIKLYESACRGREEKPRLGIVRALQSLPAAPKPRLVHLILHDTPGQPVPHPAPYPVEAPLHRYAAEALADVLAIEWGLSNLRLERGVIESEDALKPILHALLVSGTLPSLSLAGNRKIKAGGWRLLAVFLKRARALRFIDLSETNWDRRGIDYLVQALNHTTVESQEEDTANGNGAVEGEGEDGAEVRSQYGFFLPPAPCLKDMDIMSVAASIQMLRMDNCGLRSSTLEALAHGVRSSDLQHISLRNNRIGPLGAVALAVMIRDYPDTSSLSGLGMGVSADGHTGYTPRARRGAPDMNAQDDANLPPIPVVVSSSAGGVTSRVVPNGYKPPPPPKFPLVMSGGGYSAMQENAGLSLSSTSVEGKLTASELGGASLALQRSVRALDGVERIGHLLTLDLKSNDIRTGVTYIAQVLKRNRTLKVLNLSDNKLEPAGLVALAESLKYNSTLETLDISHNPCSGPTLEGIAALRTSFTVNTSLKRLFLTATGMTTEGAIDLAEFIPENRSLLHLDLTNNPAIGTAGIHAVASGLKSNRMIRCLDVSIPPNDPNLAELSQSILQSCIRNTESAVDAAKDGKEGKPARAGQDAIWAPIKKSTLVRQVKAADAARQQKEREQVVHSVQGVAREFVYRLKPEHFLPAAEDTNRGLEQWFEAGRKARVRPSAVWEGTQMPKEDFRPLIERARALTERLAEHVQSSAHPEQLERLLELNDSLTAHIAAAKGFVPPPRLLLPSQIAFAAPAAPVVTTTSLSPQGLTPRRRHMRSTSLEISSPNFSIGDSDAESDAEELDAHAIVPPPAAGKPSAAAEGSPSRRKISAASQLLVPQLLVPPQLESEGSSALSSAGGSADNLETSAAERAAERLVEAELAQGMSSPNEHVSRAWVEEEAEIFRKGSRLGVADSDSEDEDGSTKAVDPSGKSGEELKQEILDADVPRDEPRQVVESAEETESSEENEDGEGGGK